MEFVTGHRITRLVSFLARPHADRGATEDAASLLFETDQGASGTLVASQISYGRKNQLYFSFDGDLEAYQWNQERPGKFTSSNARGETTVRAGSVEMASSAAKELTYLPAGHPQGYQDAFNAFIADAYGSFQGKLVEGLPTFVDGLRAALLTDAVLKSAESGKWVNLNQTDEPAGVGSPSVQKGSTKR
jgi:predicted dehydrogenase